MKTPRQKKEGKGAVYAGSCLVADDGVNENGSEAIGPSSLEEETSTVGSATGGACEKLSILLIE